MRILRITEAERIAQVRACLPALRVVGLPDLPTYKTVLYVGANPKRFQLYGLFHSEDLTVLEAFPAYVKALWCDRRHRVGRLVQGDLLEPAWLPEVQDLVPFDLLVWWHGPEHVATERLEPFISLIGPMGPIHDLYSRAILLGAPWGRHDQEPIDDNPLQAHRSTLYPEFFQRLGYQTATLGQADVPCSHITAWRVQ